jgi:hypothetical protein
MLGVVAVVTGASFWFAPESSADVETPLWNCRASVGYIQNADRRLEPAVANGIANPAMPNRNFCIDATAGAPMPTVSAGGAPGDPGELVIQAPAASTQIENRNFPDDDPRSELGPARDQDLEANATIAQARLTSVNPAFTVSADVLSSRATGDCSGSSPVMSRTSNVAQVRFNNTTINGKDFLVPVIGVINQTPVAMLVQITLDEDSTESDPSTGTEFLVRRALHVRVTRPDTGALIFEAVVGETKVGRIGDVCAPEVVSVCPAGTTETGRQPDGSVTCQQVVTQTAPCPAGTTQDASGACVRVVVVQAPAEPGPPACPAGQVRDIAGACRTEPRSRCTGFGTGLAILGTNGSDRITGTNRADRILAFGGRDRVSGGRGNDCVEGGTGNDNLDGSNGDDRLFGGDNRDIMNGGTGRDRLVGDAGNDKLSGSSGNDRLQGDAGRDKLSGGLGKDVLIGGAGRDYIEGGPGADRVIAGTGDDVINLSESGAGRDVVNCGPGNDVVRVDSRDRFARNCERVLITIRRR